mmetsp:Transcript_17359/g.40482  ORF Transcript_17359/g.40482 Transcript_17359/m.40482 type:complete len:114 (+) Transcript_17359:265-606(+)
MAGSMPSHGDTVCNRALLRACDPFLVVLQAAKPELRQLWSEVPAYQPALRGREAGGPKANAPIDGLDTGLWDLLAQTQPQLLRLHTVWTWAWGASLSAVPASLLLGREEQSIP